MSPHVNPSMGSPAKPLPPTPKDNPAISSFRTSSPTSTPSPRIRRKPLPSTAFSPRSVISSPISLHSEKAELDRSPVPQSTAALNEILQSPSKQSSVLHPDTTHSETSSLSTYSPITGEQEKLGESLISKRPSATQREKVSLTRINDDLHQSVTRVDDMALKTGERPPPLRMESLKAVRAMDSKKPQSPGSVFTSFFSRKPITSSANASPSVESSTTDISDTASSSPHVASTEESSYFAPHRAGTSPLQRQSSWQSSHSNSNSGALRRMDSGASGSIGSYSNDLSSRCNLLEAELKEISRELAGSIRRELDLEDLVERLHGEAPPAPLSIDRTSDYFSDSGTSSGRHPTSEYNHKEEIDKIKRDSEQQRAQMRVDLSQKWQNELSQRKNLESHVQILESKLSRSRQTTNETSDASARIRELELSLDDARRRLLEERQTKENFEDLLTALRVDLEQHRNERDNLRDEVVPKLRSQLDGLESSFGDTQKQAYDFARMQQEIQSLRDENMAISSARKMEQEMMRSGMHFIQDNARSSLITPKSGDLRRSSTMSLSRSNSVLNRPTGDGPDSLADKLQAAEQQRDALHSAVKYLRSRYNYQSKTYEKKIRVLEQQFEKLNNPAHDSRRGGYEKEVRTLRHEINLLRKRADDALDQKWQCEKGLSGLKMDLDRSKQETASLQNLLQARNSDDPELLSSALESAMRDLQQTQATRKESVASLDQEQRIAEQLAESAKRAEALAIQVRQQLEANSSLRSRLMNAVQSGEKNQHASAAQISKLQSKLKALEDTITTTQLQSETAVMKHEEEVRSLKVSHTAQLMRAKAGIKSPSDGPTSGWPVSPMFANRSPRLDNTSSGPGMALNQALKTEVLQKKVMELERALSDADNQMGEVVGRMNRAQIEVFELQQERDEEHRRTRKLEAEVKAERERFQAIVNNSR